MSDPALLRLKSHLFIFEGGGAKGIAYVGAIRALEEERIFPAALAGTSAGSIVAAILAAGGNAADLEKALGGFTEANIRIPVDTKKDFFAQKPRQTSWILAIMMWVLRCTNFGKKHLPALTHGGVYSSEPLKRWIDQILKDIMHTNESVRFKDLKLPLVIPAANLRTGRLELFGPETPNELVSVAVQASCSIPAYYQPVVTGSSVYADGGLISNAPVFVTALEQNDSLSDWQEFARDAILFRLNAGEVPPIKDSQINDAEELYSALVETAVRGNSHLQIRQYPKGRRLHTIPIDSCGVPTTAGDLSKEKQTELINAGVMATQSVVTKFSVRHFDYLPMKGWDGYWTALAEMLVDYSWRECIFVNPTAKFLDYLFPLLLKNKLLSPRKITCIVKPMRPFLNADKTGVVDSLEVTGREFYRRLLLRDLGVDVVIADELPWCGAVTLGPEGGAEGEWKGLSIVLNVGPAGERMGFDSQVVKVYRSESDAGVVETMTRVVRALAKSSRIVAGNGGAVSVVEDSDGFIDRLKSSKQYRGPEIKANIEEVSLNSALPLEKYIKEYKLHGFLALSDIYQKHAIRPFTPVKISVLGNWVQITVAPPVLERTVDGKGYVIIDGITRCFSSRALGVEKIMACVVSGVRLKCPGEVRSWGDVRYVNRTISMEQNYQNYEKQYARWFEVEAHPAPDDCVKKYLSEFEPSAV